MEKPSIKTRDSKKVSSSLVSVTTRMPIYFSTVSFNCSNLFLIELIFKFPMITIFSFPQYLNCQLPLYPHCLFIFFYTLLKEFEVVLTDFFTRNLLKQWEIQ